MHLVELLLPLNDNSGRPLDAEKYVEVRQQLTERFGGLGIYPFACSGHHHGQREDGARRDHRVRSHDGNS
jgi:hypothetical protein